MGATTFSVKEFSSIYGMIEENVDNLTTKANKVMSLCQEWAQLVRSDDSDISNMYARVAETLGVAKAKVVSLLQQLESEMKLYEKNTLANEEKAEAKVKKINEEINNIAAAFNSITGRNG